MLQHFVLTSYSFAIRLMWLRAYSRGRRAIKCALAFAIGRLLKTACTTGTQAADTF